MAMPPQLAFRAGKAAALRSTPSADLSDVIAGPEENQTLVLQMRMGSRDVFRAVRQAYRTSRYSVKIQAFTKGLEASGGRRQRPMAEIRIGGSG
jgi:hypothetical protein